jgi:hypothetical protein
MKLGALSVLVLTIAFVAMARQRLRGLSGCRRQRKFLGRRKLVTRLTRPTTKGSIPVQSQPFAPLQLHIESLRELTILHRGGMFTSLTALGSDRLYRFWQPSSFAREKVRTLFRVSNQ